MPDGRPFIRIIYTGDAMCILYRILPPGFCFVSKQHQYVGAEVAIFCKVKIHFLFDSCAIAAVKLFFSGNLSIERRTHFNKKMIWLGIDAEGDVAARKTKIRSLIILGCLILLIGMGVAVVRYSRVKTAAIQPHAFPDDLMSALRSANGFQVRHAIADIPPLVRAAFAKATHQEFSMAEPGEQWQSTDVIIEPGYRGGV